MPEIQPFVHDIQEFAQAIVETVREPLLILDLDLRVQSANRAFYKTFQVEADETMGQRVYDLGDGQWNIPLLRTLLDEIIPENATFDDFEVAHSFPRIGYKVMLLNARRVHHPNDHTELLILAMEDATERINAKLQLHNSLHALEIQSENLEKANVALESANTALEKANVDMEALATTDSLTTLYNHRSFQERLAQEFHRARRYSEPLSLILLDIDNFKPFNDEFGHLAGNAALVTLSLVLKESIRETDLAFRFGGEEFILLLPHTQNAKAVLMAERVRALIEMASWEQRGITVSLGVCVLTPDLDSPDALVACADTALYRAKAAGRNRVSSIGQ